MLLVLQNSAILSKVKYEVTMKEVEDIWMLNTYQLYQWHHWLLQKSIELVSSSLLHYLNWHYRCFE